MPDIIRLLPKQVINVVPAGAGVGEMKEEYGRSLQILLAVCALVLLIACANVANLLLARSVARRGQTAVRLAVGASRRQIVAQALLESVVLAIAGGVAGLVVAVGAAQLLLALAFRNSHFLPISTWPSLMVLAFAFGVALLTGIIFGAAPAWFATRTDPVEALRGAGRATGDRSSFARKALLVVQATLSVVLVAGATMLARSLNKLEQQDFGYRLDGRVVVSLNRPPATYTQPKLAAMYRQLEARLNRLPGVRGSGLALYNPLTDNWGEMILVAGHPPPKMAENAGASWDRVSATYLQNFGVTLLRGRMFTDADTETTAPVAIVNEAFVKRFFKSDEDPLDQHFGLDLPENAGTFRIVGIVRDAKFAGWGLNQPARPMFYVPLAQNVQLRERADATNRAGVPFHWRHDARHRFVAGNARATADQGPRRSRPGSDDHQRADHAAAGRTVLRPGARRGEPRRPVRDRRLVAGRGRPVRRHGLHRRPTDQRDRPPHGARGRSHQRHAPGAARRVHASDRGTRPRHSAGDRRGASARRTTVRGSVLGPDRAGDRRGRIGDLRFCRGYHPRRSRCFDLADERAQDRVKTERSPFTRSFLRRSSKPIPSVAFSQAILRGLLVAMWLRAA